MKLSRIRKFYTLLALFVVNVLVAFVLLNLLVLAYVEIRKGSDRAQAPNQIEAEYGSFEELYPVIYPGYSLPEVRTLLDETWRRNYVYEPFTQHREAAHEGLYVNVSETGIRRSLDPGPWPPDPADFNVFVFGGSTTFGYGIADQETIPSQLQKKLAGRWGNDVRVYNLGRGAYSSSQERILFESLLSRGTQPDLAIFIDGLNEFSNASDAPHFTERISRLIDRGKKPLLCERNGSLHFLPLCKLLRYHVPKPAEETVVDREVVDSILTV